MSNEALKPCPFCGGKPSVFGRTCDKHTPYDPSHRAFPIVRCGCGATASGKDWGHERTAVEAWNRRALASLPEGAETAWQPIETAPKDGTPIIGYEGGELRECSWEPLDNPVARQWGLAGTWHRRHVGSGKALLGSSFVPTHWMPLPNPPAAAIDEATKP